jgi:diguanylate cyclase
VPVTPPTQKHVSPATLLVEAQSALLASDLDVAKAHTLQAEALAEAMDDQLMRARSVAMLARILHLQNEMDEAYRRALEGALLCEEAGDLTAAAQAHEVAARILLDVGDMDEALKEGLKATEAAEATNDLVASVAAMRAMTNIYAALRQWDTALEYGERYSETTRLLGDPSVEGIAVATVAYVYGAMFSEASDRGDDEQARVMGEQSATLSRAAMMMSRAAGNRLNENTAVANLAELLSEIGRPQEALDLLDSWPADPVLDTGNMIAHHRESRGTVLARLGRYQEAAELLALAVAEAPTRQYRVTACRALAMVLEELDDLRGALDAYKQLFTLVTEQISDQALRAASVAAVRLETAQARARLAQAQMEASALQQSNENLSRHSDDLRRQALEDPLTGLPNRRRLDQLLASDLRSFTLVLLDVDHFKRVNDGHSHLVGDAVLRELGNVLSSTCRDGDTALRFGGEEFALLMQGTSREGAMKMAERARMSVQSYDWAALAPGLAVTASFGVAMGDEVDTSIELLALADRRMLTAKENGRNQVIGPERVQ